MAVDVYIRANNEITRHDIDKIKSIKNTDKPSIIWIDAHNISEEEAEVIDDYLSIETPTRGQMREIELSNRIYQKDGAIFMIATLAIGERRSANCAFILKHECFVTVHHQAIPILERLSEHILNSTNTPLNGRGAFVESMKYAIDFSADTLEQLTCDLDEISNEIFWPGQDRYIKGDTNHNATLYEIGRVGDLLSRAYDSLITIIRVIGHAIKSFSVAEEHRTISSELEITLKDANALKDHASFLSSKVDFLLNATLGMINVDQNSIIKIVSVASAVFLPPTLIASIYGMNFAFMPILQKPWGYPLALAMIVMSSALPYIYFKWRKWL